jgi:hypothetical protein
LRAGIRDRCRRGAATSAAMIALAGLQACASP